MFPFFQIKTPSSEKDDEVAVPPLFRLAPALGPVTQGCVRGYSVRRGCFTATFAEPGVDLAPIGPLA